MERRTNSPYPRLDRPVLAIIGLVLVLSTVLFTVGDRQHEWRYYQFAFRNAVAEKYGPAKADTVRAGLQQVWVPDLGRADRCTTCHQAVQWAGFEAAEDYASNYVAKINIGRVKESKLCAMDVTLKGATAIDGKKLRLTLQEDGTWSVTSNLPMKFLPRSVREAQP